ncbi:hypothetical protein [Streptomyces sp. 061-3]|uniref:hypothetical protein n=1 Tax=Streptomyces sp. 061-3 TaxID=2789268 RepID=UPI003981617B
MVEHLGVAMASWLEELERRQAVARERVAELRARIGELTRELAGQEEVLSRLEITRGTMTEILSQDDAVAGPSVDRAGEVEAADPQGEAEESWPYGASSPVEVLLVPPWAEELGLDVLPGPYRDIVEVLADAVQPMRAKQLAATLGLSTDATKVEGFRSKLKRLAERGWIAEVGPGLFAPRGTPPLPGRAPGQRWKSSPRR